jgi:hypothetical protein
MNAKKTSLFAGIALLAGVGMANAEERLTAASMDNVTAAGGMHVHHGHPHHPPVPVTGLDAAASTLAVCVGSSDCNTSGSTTAVVDAENNISISAATATASSHH